MKKLTTSVLIVVVSSSFALINAQRKQNDTIIKETSIGEVIITGALNMKKKLDAQTSSVSVVNSDALTQANNQNAVQSLSGKVTGLQINQSNSSVNGSFDIKLRGSRTISGSTTPLIVIDGVISTVSIYSQLPSDMIESVSVLKGLQGAALYGSQGVNGAIIVSTKRGTNSKKVKVTLNNGVDFENIAFLPARQKQYGQGWYGERIHVENGAWGPAYNDPAYAGQSLPYGIPLYDVNNDGTISINGNDGNTPQQDIASSIYLPFNAPSSANANLRKFFQTGTTYTNGVTIGAGDSNGYASLSLLRQDKEFIIMDDKSKKTTAIFKGGMKKDRWTIDGTFSFINQSNNTTPADIYSNILQSAPEIDITKWKGALNDDRAYTWTMFFQNPYWNIKHYRSAVKTNNISGTVSLSYKVNDHITILDNGTGQYNTGDGRQWRDLYSGATPGLPTIAGVTALNSLYNQYNTNSTYFYNDIMARFDYNLTDDINSNLTVGWNVQDTYGKGTAAGGNNLNNPGIYTVWNVLNPTQPYSFNGTNSLTRVRKYAGFANLDLSYKDYLYLNATVRSESSSVFISSDTNYESKFHYTYPSVGLSFIPKNAFESLKNSNTLSRFVVKGSYTMVGNDPVASYAIENTAVVAPGFPFGTNPLSFIVNPNPTNPAIKPEFVTSTEFNLGLGFFKDRITLDANVFNNSTKDLITQRTTSSASGISSQRFNIGKIRTRGIELDLGFTPIKTSDFRWDGRISYYADQQEVLDLPSGVDEVALYSSGNVGVYAIRGEKYPVIKGTGYLRDDQGRIIVDEATGDPKATNSFINLGNANPKYTLTFNTNIRYKNWEVSATMDYRTGHKFYADQMANLAFGGYLEQSAEFDRTQGGYVIPNSVYMNSAGQYVANTSIKSGGNDYSHLPTYYGGVYSSIAENFVIDATAFKVRELALSYTLGKDMVRSTGLDGLTIGVYARNPFRVFSKENRNYSDPESNVSNGNNVMGIAARSQYPTTRIIGFNTTINF